VQFEEKTRGCRKRCLENRLLGCWFRGQVTNRRTRQEFKTEKYVLVKSVTAQDAVVVLYDVLLHCKMLCGNFVIFPIELQQVMNDRSELIRRGKTAKGDTNQIHQKADVVMASAVEHCGDSEDVVDAGFTLNVRRDDLRHQVYAFNDHIQSLQHRRPSALPS
jgi:hypothetical protein